MLKLFEKTDLNINNTRLKGSILEVQDVGIIRNNNRYDRNTGLNSQMKSTLLEGQEFRLGKV